MTNVRFQLKLAEDNLFALFNDLNSSDEFDIDCKKVRSIRSRIGQRTCEPKFLTRRRQQNARVALHQERTILDDPLKKVGTVGLNFGELSKYLEEESEVRSVLSGKYQALGEEMLVIASEHPEYLRALVGVNTLKTELNALKQERFGN